MDLIVPPKKQGSKSPIKHIAVPYVNGKTGCGERNVNCRPGAICEQVHNSKKPFARSRVHMSYAHEKTAGGRSNAYCLSQGLATRQKLLCCRALVSKAGAEMPVVKNVLEESTWKHLEAAFSGRSSFSVLLAFIFFISWQRPPHARAGRALFSQLAANSERFV